MSNHSSPPEPELQIFIPTVREFKNLRALLPWVRHILEREGIRGEICIVDATNDQASRELCQEHGVRFLVQPKRGFGEALRFIWETASAPWMLTMDADFSHPPDFISRLWEARHHYDVIIASRYLPGGGANTSWLRKFLSRCLNLLSRWILQTNIRDLTSNFRLYRTHFLKDIKTHRVRFDVLQEILVRLMNKGCRIGEIPFFYEPRFAGASSVRLWRFGWDYLKAVFKDWRIRNSTDAVDYDLRAYSSIIPLQRYWQKKRYRIVSDLARSAQSVLDVGCGTSRIIIDYPHWIGVDINYGKLRYLKPIHPRLALASVSEFPFKTESMECIVCSQVIEHIQDVDRFWKEFYRVLRPNGILILGTPDYGMPFWPFFEYLHDKALPESYMKEHCMPWTRQNLIKRLHQEGFEFKKACYILKAELIVLAVKRGLHDL